jgi:NAD(P)H-dependent flavin oxidoreductase YrpB (nitropropane dioxygenase family)
VLASDWVDAGAVVNAMGSNVANRRELPADLVQHASSLVADSVEQARIEAGDLILALCQDPARRARAVESIVRQVRAGGADGASIDQESLRDQLLWANDHPRELHSRVILSAGIGDGKTISAINIAGAQLVPL